MAENPKYLSIMAGQGLENMMKVNVIHFKRGPGTSKDKKKITLFPTQRVTEIILMHHNLNLLMLRIPDLEISGLFRPEK